MKIFHGILPPLFQLCIYIYILFKVQLIQLTLHTIIICLVLCLNSRRQKQTTLNTAVTTFATTTNSFPPPLFSSLSFKLGGRSPQGFEIKNLLLGQNTCSFIVRVYRSKYSTLNEIVKDWETFIASL